jgi:hypothetical protein
MILVSKTDIMPLAKQLAIIVEINICCGFFFNVSKSRWYLPILFYSSLRLNNRITMMLVYKNKNNKHVNNAMKNSIIANANVSTSSGFIIISP